MITKQDILEEFNEEVPATRKMLERVPFDKLDFKPSPKSMSLGQLAFMLGSMPGWFISIIEQDSLDTATYQQPPKPQNVQELVESFDAGVEAVQEALANMDVESLDATWSFKVNGKVMMALPRRVVLPQTVRHLVHHRAQLGVYLKMNGIPHPAVYGASGDEH